MRAIAFVTALLICTGCVSSTQSNRRDDVLVVAQAWEPLTLNPLLHIDYNAYELDNLVYSMLLQQDADGRLVPDLATRVPSLANGQISRDGVRIVYHLRRNVRWQDGRPLTADDVVFSYDAIMNPNNAVPSRDGYDAIARIQAPDAYTIVLHLKRPFASILSFFFAPGQGYPVLPAHLLARYGSLNAIPFNQLPVGSGPYRVVRWKRGDRLELDANATYFAGTPKIKHIVIRYVPADATIINLLRTGEADAYFMADPSEVGFVRESVTLTVRSHPVGGVQEIIFNVQSALLRNSRLRHALALSLNIPYIARSVGHGWFSSREARRGQFYWAFDPRVPDQAYDPAAADRLLDEAGWRRGRDGIRSKDGRPLLVEFSFQSGRPIDATIGLLFQQEARARGVLVSLKSYRIEQFVAPANLGGPLYGGHFQAAALYGGFPDPDVSHVDGCAAVAPNGYNFSRYCNPVLDAAARAATSTFDLRVRSADYAIVQRILARDLPAIVLWQDREIDIVPARLREFEPSITSPFYRASRWQLEPR